jgi:hypothetical protein
LSGNVSSGSIPNRYWILAVYIGQNLKCVSTFVIHSGRKHEQVLDSGPWILDKTSDVFCLSCIEHRASSIQHRGASSARLGATCLNQAVVRANPVWARV